MMMAWRKQIRRKIYQIPDTTNSNSIINLGLKIKRDTRDQRHLYQYFTFNPMQFKNCVSSRYRELQMKQAVTEIIAGRYYLLLK